MAIKIWSLRLTKTLTYTQDSPPCSLTFILLARRLIEGELLLPISCIEYDAVVGVLLDVSLVDHLG